MPKYRVAVTLTHELNDDDLEKLLIRKSTSIDSYEMGAGNVVIVGLRSPNSLTALETAEIQVQRGTGLEIASAHLLLSERQPPRPLTDTSA